MAGSFVLPGLASRNITPAEAQAIAVEAYVFLYPLVLMDLTRLQMTNVAAAEGMNAPANMFARARAYPAADFRSVARPNFDTLYSMLWLDLTNEPMIVSLPDAGGRYYLAPALDMWTDVNASPGWRTTGTAAADFAYVPPGWTGDLPADVAPIVATTPYLWMILRTRTNGPDDYDAVHRFQDGMTVRPLSAWRGGRDWTAPTPATDPAIDMTTPPLVQVNDMAGAEFFEYATRLMRLHAPHAMDYSQVWRMARLGIVPGEVLDYVGLDPVVQRALDAAPSLGLAAIRAHLPKVGDKVDTGWVMPTHDVGAYGVEYLQRATVAMLGLGANLLPDAIYPQLTTDAAGRPLTGGGAYVLHFDTGQLPPVDAFWSVTLYDDQGFQVANPLNRFDLADWMPLRYNADGSLDLIIQPDPPGADRQSNWLPAPASGTFNLTMRLYAPQPRALNGDWVPPAISVGDAHGNAGRQAGHQVS